MDDDVDELDLEYLLLESFAWWKVDREEWDDSTDRSLRLSGEELVDLAKQFNDLVLRGADEDDAEYKRCKERLGGYCREMRRRWNGRSPW